MIIKFRVLNNVILSYSGFLMEREKKKIKRWVKNVRGNNLMGNKKHIIDLWHMLSIQKDMD